MATESQNWAVIIPPDEFSSIAIPLSELDRFLQNVQYVSAKRYCSTNADRFVARSKNPVHEVNIITNDHFNLLKIKEMFTSDSDGI